MVIFQLLFLAFTAFGCPIFASAVTSHATVYFSPEDQLAKRLIEQIDKENKSVHVCIYAFTHRGIANSLIEAKKRGAEVEVIVDRFSVKAGAPLQKLSDEGIPVYVWDPDPLKRMKSHRPLMHNKFCVLGMDKVWTGSFNFTYDATNIHQENAIILEDGAIASAYKGQFHMIKLRSCIPLNSFVAVQPHKRKMAQKRIK
jgi:phosphatidylserine/phosphatidylglycerophosphate/cardiolipin synthase-like enzyme